MARFVLVHGAWHGAWCWRHVVAALEEIGHVAEAFDLPGHGDDPATSAGASLKDYVDACLAVLERKPEPAFLVGHSMAGIVISQAAEAAPGRIRGLVYLGAVLIRDGEAMLDFAGEADPEYLGSLEAVEGQDALTISAAGLEKFLYNLTPPSTMEWARSKFRAEAVGPMRTPLSLTPGRFESVRRYYIDCVHDRLMPKTLVAKLLAASPCNAVYSLDSDHVPFFSAPIALARRLDAIARVHAR